MRQLVKSLQKQVAARWRKIDKNEEQLEKLKLRMKTMMLKEACAAEERKLTALQTAIQVHEACLHF